MGALFLNLLHNKNILHGGIEDMVKHIILWQLKDEFSDSEP